MILSRRVQAIKPSPTLAVTARAALLKSQGQDIIGLGAGEPDFDTPQHIKEAAHRAIRDGFTKYTQVGGIPALKDAVRNKFQKENALHYSTKQILVSAGGKHCIFNLCMALLNPGDEVIIPAPYWVSYPDITLIAEGKPIFISTTINDQFKIKPEQLSAAITTKTKLLFINSPNNPTGAVYSHTELQALGEVLRHHPQVYIATDDMYEHILLDDLPFVNILNACPDLHPRTIVLNGVSKAYSMTGWRIGYCAGPEELITAMENVQSQSTSNPSSISQMAALMALTGEQNCITPMVEAFRERHQFVVAQLNVIPGVRCLRAGGAFYAFPDVSSAIDRLVKKNVLPQADDLAFSEYLLEKAQVAVVPGSAFGLANHIRISFATSMRNLQNALQRIEQALN